MTSNNLQATPISMMFADGHPRLDPTRIQSQLIRLEDTILFSLIERAQFPLNKDIYIPGAVEIKKPRGKHHDLSLMDFLLCEQEALESRIGCFSSPDECPFFPDALEKSIVELPSRPHSHVLYAHDSVNVNSIIKPQYITKVLPLICPSSGESGYNSNFNWEGGSMDGTGNGNAGSAATCDIACLQALSRRIHLGKYIAEYAFQTRPDVFSSLLAQEGNVDGVSAALAEASSWVDDEGLAQRLTLKAKSYGMDPSFSAEKSGKIDVNAVLFVYQEIIMPLTNRVGVEYLIQRHRGIQSE
ncbi:chorismate mutase [Aspergillus insuetus]